MYKIESRKTANKFLALKVVDKKSQDYPKIAKRLFQEIQIHSKLSHQNIVKFFDCFEDSDNHYLLLECCEQGDLYTFLRSKPNLKENELKSFGRQIAEGIYYLHEKQVLHRDLKLSNVLMKNDNLVVR